MQQQHESTISPFIKFAFGFVAFAMEMTATIYNTFELFFITDVALLSPALAAWVGALYRIWSSISDPVVGNLSDKTSNLKWGRRRGWMLAAAFPYAIFYVCTWLVPGSNSTFLFIYFLLIKCASDFAWSCIRVPHTAFINDLSTDYGERYRLNIIRFGASGAGSLIAVAMAAGLSKLIPKPRVKFPILGLILGGVIVSSILLLVFKTKEYSQYHIPMKAKQASVWSRLKAIMKVRTAVLVIIMSSFAMITMQTTVTLVPYLIEDYLLLHDFDVLIVMMIVLASGFVTIAILYKFSKRFEKRTVYAFAGMLWISFYAVVPLVNPHRIWVLYILVVFLGSGLASCIMTSTSMINDAADFVEIETGLKVEGMLFGLNMSLNKIIIALVVFMFEQIISSTGFHLKPGEKAELPPKTLTAMRAMFVCFPLIFLVITLICNYFLPITVQKMGEISRALENTRERNSIMEDATEEEIAVNFNNLGD
jgi:GPH family glycoside/pentoside/hexuronide:cation symporter